MASFKALFRGAREIGGVIRAALAAVFGDGRKHAQRPCHDRVFFPIAVWEFAGDDALRCDILFHPLLQSHHHVVFGALILRYTEELSYDVIAEILRCPPGTVASRLNRAHKKQMAG